MAAISPTLKVGLGLASAAAAFTLLRSPGPDDVVISEIFESPLALIDDGNITSPSWNAPPVTRNPFVSAGLAIDAGADEEIGPVEATVPATTAAIGGPPTSAATAPGVSTTQPTLSLEETVSRRVPPGAPAVTTATPSDG